ncbi:WhiB family transcriptional regulator [Nocardia cyriacigeorgica]|uniref:WhiB family transcriptional regulator n=1 Tax=Nocardia cyriacigeorgica TaxID=135487 RepID=UPI0018933776|nr:WhiB family transcriptional regulator [Nocardia cyriacigeorgica]MBF6286914.1 WhiB family transcriptional regulator [Nocardia cyriacigeorgica]
MTGKSKWPAAVEWLATLFDERLVGAACVGRPELFDDHRSGESDRQATARHEVAARICRRCPVREQCDAAAAELGSSASGIWAGEARNAGQPVGRPRKATA